jgi:hypothetical protein
MEILISVCIKILTQMDSNSNTGGSNHSCSVFLFPTDRSECGFNVFDGAPSDGDGEESDDFLFEVSDTPLDPTYRLPNSRTKA